jgi:hypothetical protein
LWRAVFDCKYDGKTVEVLLKAGAGATKENNHGMSAAAHAALITNYDVAQFFTKFP